MNSPKFWLILLITAIVVWVVSFNIWPFAWKGAFYQGNALHLLLLYFYTWQREKERWNKTVLGIGFWFAVNNILDELFFDPTTFGINEYLYAVLVIIISLIQARKQDGESPK